MDHPVLEGFPAAGAAGAVRITHNTIAPSRALGRDAA